MARLGIRRRLSAPSAAPGDRLSRKGGAGRVSRPLTILSVGYALAPVGPDAVGGSEQILSALDRALVEAGHRSLVVACRGSAAAGEWIDTGFEPVEAIDDPMRYRAEALMRDAIARVLARERVDLVHAHGLDFAATLPAGSEPRRLVTLHLPPHWYPELASCPGDWLHCVSATQQRACATDSRLLPFIANGVPIEALARSRPAKRGFALHLGRVCHEKGQHLALQAAHRAGVPLVLGGAIFPYAAHRDYFASAVAPLLDSRHRFVGPLDLVRKRRFLSAATCLLVPSLVPETSSLVAMEAAACGTPVIALRSGALPEIVEHGRTGFIVDDLDAMTDAIARVDTIDPDVCRAVARERFSQTRMIDRYLARYAELCGVSA